MDLGCRVVRPGIWGREEDADVVGQSLRSASQPANMGLAARGSRE